MERREFLAVLGGAVLALPRTAAAQATGKTYRLGTLSAALPMSDTTPLGKALIKSLSELGYVVGQNLTIDARGAAGDAAKIPSLLQELKASHVDALVVAGYPAAVAAK